MERHAAIARRALVALARSIEKITEAINGARGRAGGRRRRNLTPKDWARLQLQGQYLGLTRHLKPKQKAELKAIREKQGYEAAIRRARRFVGAA